MHTVASPFIRAYAAAALICGLAIASPSFAASPSSSASAKGQSDYSSEQNSAVENVSTGGKKGHTYNPEEAAERVETRIQTLHDKLKITPDQESAWNDVAQAMRDSESSIGNQVQARHANATSMTAVEDLQSYQKIAQAHADGMSKVISSFQSLYDDMSDAQKKNADQVFGQFQGHRGMAKASASKKKGAGSNDSSSSSD